MALGPRFATRTSQRRVSIARRRARAKCMSGSPEVPNQPSSVRVMSSVAPLSRTNSRTEWARVISKQIGVAMRCGPNEKTEASRPASKRWALGRSFPPTLLPRPATHVRPAGSACASRSSARCAPARRPGRPHCVLVAFLRPSRRRWLRRAGGRRGRRESARHRADRATGNARGYAPSGQTIRSSSASGATALASTRLASRCAACAGAASIRSDSGETSACTRPMRKTSPVLPSRVPRPNRSEEHRSPIQIPRTESANPAAREPPRWNALALARSNAFETATNSVSPSGPKGLRQLRERQRVDQDRACPGVEDLRLQRLERDERQRRRSRDRQPSAEAAANERRHQRKAGGDPQHVRPDQRERRERPHRTADREAEGRGQEPGHRHGVGDRTEDEPAEEGATPGASGSMPDHHSAKQTKPRGQTPKPTCASP